MQAWIKEMGVYLLKKRAGMASKGATGIAEKLRQDYLDRQPNMGESLTPVWAALIDAELAEVLPFLDHDEFCALKRGKVDAPECTCGLDALRAKWSAGMAEKVKKLVRETATPDLHKAVMNISEEVTDLRDTVKLAIAFERTTPWHEVSESEVDAYLKLLRELKANQRTEKRALEGGTP